MVAKRIERNAPLRLMIVIGTRPEAIKLAPLILGARRQPENFETTVVTTGQHREMLDQMLRQFKITPDYDLDIMQPNQDLAHVTIAALEGLAEAIRQSAPDIVVVQGDTTTTFAGALAAFYAGVAVGHVEAGLRTHDRRQPWPEEVNRCLTSQLTDYHFAPTELSKQNLLREGISEDRIWVTGNTAIDALFITLERARASAVPATDGHVEAGNASETAQRRRILVTAHRRENHGAPLESICRAIKTIVSRFDDVEVIFPVHMSPRVRRTVFSYLSDEPRVNLVEPLDYEPFVQAMSEAHLILTDSGGVQEEAPSLGKPVLVLRDSTERPEAAQAEVARIIGTDESNIVREVSRLLTDAAAYERMSAAINPFGDGHAAETILQVLNREQGSIRTA